MFHGGEGFGVGAVGALGGRDRAGLDRIDGEVGLDVGEGGGVVMESEGGVGVFGEGVFADEKSSGGGGCRRDVEEVGVVRFEQVIDVGGVGVDFLDAENVSGG